MSKRTTYLISILSYVVAVTSWISATGAWLEINLDDYSAEINLYLFSAGAAFTFMSGHFLARAVEATKELTKE